MDLTYSSKMKMDYFLLAQNKHSALLFGLKAQSGQPERKFTNFWVREIDIMKSQINVIKIK